MRLFNNIGIGVAFSPNLTANVCETARLALFFDSKLILIHVGSKTSEKKEKLLSLSKDFVNKGLDCEFVFKSGNAVDVILSVSKNKNIDLLVLGALQRENILKYYVGSIARKITRQAHCSVLLLIKPSVERVPCKHIVVNGLDDPKTEHTIQAAFYVGTQLGIERISIVEEIGQEEVAVRVEDDKSLLEATITKERLRHREASRVKKIVDNLPPEFTNNIAVKSQPIFGKRGYSISHYAQIVRADLLIMNSPTKTSFLTRLIPHDIEYILAELPTDLLILK